MTNLGDVIAGVLQSVVPHGASHDKRGSDEIIGVLPVGAGTWFWGTTQQIPSGWSLADGTFSVNGATVPDMRDKMPIGAGTTYALGATGGAASATLAHDHNHTGSHTHSATGGGTSQDIGTLAWLASAPSSINSANPDAHSSHTVATLPPYAAWYFIVRTR